MALHVRPECSSVTWQEEAKRIAQQAHAVEESRAKLSAELSARDAALTQREEAAAGAARRQQEDLRKRASQDEQVICIITINPAVCHVTLSTELISTVQVLRNVPLPFKPWSPLIDLICNQSGDC